MFDKAKLIPFTRAVFVWIGDQQFCVTFNNDNVDYKNFKEQINSGTLSLEDENGVLMTAEDAKAFVATLP